MSKRRKRTKAKPTTKPPRTPENQTRREEPADIAPKLVAILPGALMYRMELPPGVPDTDTLRTRQLALLVESPQLAAIPEANRKLLVDSLARTLGRAEYHYRRFRQHRETLDATQEWAPGEVFWNGLLSCAHYELQGLAGAARLFLDELLLVVALRYDPGLSGNQEKKWAAPSVLRDPPGAGTSIDVPEVHRLRSHRKWFDLLNAYRNAFFHAGSQHGSGHYDADAGSVSRLPERNGLLVPDQASLSRRPYEWTWNDGTTIDDVAGGIYDELLEVVAELCEAEWGTALPAPGSAPKERTPTLIVTLIKPIVFLHGDLGFIPMFSSREKAETFMKTWTMAPLHKGTAQPELARIRSNLMGDQNVLSLSLRGLEDGDGFAEVKRLHIYLDPVRPGARWDKIRATTAAEGSVEAIVKDVSRIVSLPLEGPMTAYVWRSSNDWL